MRPSIDRRKHYLVPAVIGPRCQAPAEVLQGPGTLADTCGGAAQKQQTGRGAKQHAVGHMLWAEATVVPLLKLKLECAGC